MSFPLKVVIDLMPEPLIHYPNVITKAFIVPDIDYPELRAWSTL